MATENDVTENDVSVVKKVDAKDVGGKEGGQEEEEGVAVVVDPVKESLEAVPTRKERLQKVMADLEIQRAAILNCTLEWKEFEEYFTELEGIMQKRLEDLVAKEKAYELKYEEMQKALVKREEAVASREQAMLSRVQEQKDHAIASLFEEKRKWLEERSRLEAESVFKAPLTNGVVSAEITSRKPEPDRPAEAAIVNGSALNFQAMEVDVASSKPAGNVTTKAVEHEGAANGSVPARKSDVTTTTNAPPTSNAITPSSTTSPTNNTPAPAPTPKAVVPEVRVRPQLKALCEVMDGDGLRKYIVDHRKDVGALRNELPSALQCAIDPARMVLGALEGYHLPEPASVAVTNSSPQQQGGSEKDKESGASANRRACILLLECLAVVLADPVLGADHPVVPTNVKESAKQVADQWKSRMNLQGDAAGNSLDAQAFLQLLATFGIASEYNDDELCKLVTAVARRRQTPALCRSLGLSAKIPDVVDRLAKEGKQIEALSFAHSFGIMDRVQPIPLLKSYLKEARRTAQSILRTGNSSAAAQNDATMKELAALKAVLKCIEEYQLESQYPSTPLQKRVVQLEKAKSDRKRAAVAVKAQTKRPRASNGTGAGYAATTNANNNDSRNYYRGASDRGQYGSVGVTAYGLQTQNAYDRRGQGGYSTTYAADIAGSKAAGKTEEAQQLGEHKALDAVQASSEASATSKDAYHDASGYAGDTADKGKKAASDAGGYVGDKAKAAGAMAMGKYDQAKQGAANARDYAGDKVKAAGAMVMGKYDQTKQGASDAREYAGYEANAPGAMAEEKWENTNQAASEAGDYAINNDVKAAQNAAMEKYGQIKQGASDARERAGAVVKAAGDMTGEKYDQGKQGASDVRERAGAVAKAAGDMAGEKYDQGKQGASDAAGYAQAKANAAGDMAGEKWDQSKQGASDALERAGATAKAAGDMAGEKWDQSKQAASDAAGYAQAKANAAGDVAGEKWDQTKQAGLDARNQAGEKSSDARNYAGEKASAAGDVAARKWEQSKQMASSAGGMAAGALGAVGAVAAAKWDQSKQAAAVAGDKANAASDVAAAKWDQGKQAAADARGYAGEKTSAAGETAGQKWEQSKQAAAEVRDYAADKMNQGRQATADSVDYTQEKFNVGRDVAAEKWDQTKEATSDAVQYAADKANAAKGSASGTAQQASTAAGEKYEQAKQVTVDAAEAAKERAAAAKELMAQQSTSGIRRESFFTKAGDAVNNALQKVKESVSPRK